MKGNQIQMFLYVVQVLYHLAISFVFLYVIALHRQSCDSAQAGLEVGILCL